MVPEDEVARRTGRLDGLGGDRPPFGFVAVQQLLFCGPVDDHRELPGEVLRVTDAGVHPLTTERAVDMGGVTGEQDPAVTVGLGEPAVDPERRDPRGDHGPAMDRNRSVPRAGG